MDIVERLRWLERDKEAKDNLPAGLFKLVGDAATKIERLRAALKKIQDCPFVGTKATITIRGIAGAALSDEQSQTEGK